MPTRSYLRKNINVTLSIYLYIPSVIGATGATGRA